MAGRTSEAVPSANQEIQAHTQAVAIVLRLSEAERLADKFPERAGAIVDDLLHDWHGLLANAPALRDKHLLPSLSDRITHSPIGPKSPATRLLYELSCRRSGSRPLKERLEKRSFHRAIPASPRLFMLLGQMPDGRSRMLVYADLLAVLPAHYSYEVAQTIWQDVLVEVIGNPATADHLRVMADRVEENLRKSPFSSALIAQAVHSLHELALYQTEQDSSIITRSDDMRKSLLDLEVKGLPLASV
jgi:hypothetical protein